ncbi:MAG: hypothetical protein ABIC96_02005 [Patescibacteria group bacterium]
MSPEKPSQRTLRPRKAQQLINYSKDEVENFKSGDVDRLSSINELSAQFGYSPRTVYEVLSLSGIAKERKLLKKDKEFIPSDDLAWMLGSLSGGGTVDQSRGAILVNRTPRAFTQKFQSVGERLFGINAKLHRDKPIFYDNETAQKLGDLRIWSWPNTVLERHEWILTNQRYIWSFLTGLFDARGSIRGEENPIIFHSKYSNVVNFTADLLVKCGIERPTILPTKQDLEEVQGVAIFNAKDKKTFATNVHSVIPEKEKMLREYRKESFRVSRVQVESERELIAEWKKLYDSLGHIPSAAEINMLKRNGKTRWSHGAYNYRFGRGNIAASTGRYSKAVESLLSRCFPEETTEELLSTRRHHFAQQYKRAVSLGQLIEEYGTARRVCLEERKHLPTVLDIADLRRRQIITRVAQTFSNYFGGGNFLLARDNLEAIIEARKESSSNQIREINAFLILYEAEKDIQVRYVPKIHRAPEDEARIKLEEIIRECSRYNQPPDISLKTVPEAPTKKPRAGTKRAMIITYLRTGKSSSEIAHLLGLPRNYIGAVKTDGIRSGYLPKPTEDGKRILRGDYGVLVSLSQGGRMLAVLPLARIGMLPKEIVYATPITEGKPFSYEQVRHARDYLIQTGRVDRLAGGDMKRTNSNRLGREKEDKIQERVRLWLTVRAILTENGLDKTPKNRADWLLLTEYLNALKQSILGDKQPMEVFDKKKQDLPVPRLARLQSCIDVLTNAGK